MRILNINSFYSPKCNKSPETFSNNQFDKNIAKGDVVSFSAKKYDADDIVNPTNHCAYCGCKVYSEQQIDSIAKEMLSSKYDRLQGKIKSVLEKLDGAKYSEELSLAKRLENEDEIAFFRNLLDNASKKPYLKGEVIFEQVYRQNSSQAFELLRSNLKPLLKTVDHVSPQNEGKDNNNSDINLVESCWCCNHDLKKGSTFIEFYTMYPSIKNNMPPEKFQYAASSLLDSHSNGIIQRLSATNLLKTIQRLFIQRNEAKTYLDSIDFRIKTSISAINSAIETSHNELSEKEAELKQREDQLTEMKKDEEFQAILDRIIFSREIEAKNGLISQLRAKSQSISSQINELRNPSKKKTAKSAKDQHVDDLSPEEKKEKIEFFKSQVMHIEEQVLDLEIKKEELNQKIRLLDQKFPNVPTMQHKKNQADTIINAHQQLAKINAELRYKYSELESQQNKKKALIDQIASFPTDYSSVDSFPIDVQNEYNRYIELVNALEYILEHPNGGGVNHIIKQSAKVTIEKEIADLSQNPLVIQHKRQQERSRLENEKSTLEKNITALNNSISLLNNNKKRYQATASSMSMGEAIRASEDWTSRIRMTNDKEQYIKLPQIIDSIKSEILLIKQTISDLSVKLDEIQSDFPIS